MSGTRKIEQGHYLFREGDPPDAMYVIKSGKLAVTKSKQNSEIILAELGAGAMVGEMAFFDNKARSASVKAVKESEVIALPYKALHAQFATFPEWAKAIMRTVNDHLRAANTRIKALDNMAGDAEEFFPAQSINRLAAILHLVAARYGAAEGASTVVPSNTLRDYTVQVFQEASSRMQKFVQCLAEMKLATYEELEEGKQHITLASPAFVAGFSEWYNNWLSKREDERQNLKPDDVNLLAGVLHYAKLGEKNGKGQVKLNLTKIQASSQKDLGFELKVELLDLLTRMGLMSEKAMEPDGVCAVVQIEDLEKIAPYWQLLQKLRSAKRDT